MKKIVILFCCMFLTYSYGQTTYKYYMYLYNSSYAPTFKKQGNYVVYNGTDPSLQTFFGKYKITRFEKAFPAASTWESFSRVLMLETESSNLAADLMTNYSSIYRKYDNLTNDVFELTSYPNDYGSTNPNGNTGANINRDDLDYMNVAKAWDITTGSGVTIGISDARINTTDADYAGKVSFVNPGSYQTLAYNANNMETSHGTGVAGIAAAQGDNNYGSTGVCYNCNIKGTAYGNYNNLIALAQTGVRVINMSWANMTSSYAAGYREAEQMVVDSLVNHYKVILVAAAGNRSSYQTTTDYFCEGGSQTAPYYTGTQFGFPASYNGVISVSSVAHKYPLTLPLQTTSPTYCCPSPTGIQCYGGFQGQFGGTINGNDPNNPFVVLYNGWPQGCDVPNYITSPNGLTKSHTSNPYVDILAPTASTFRFDLFSETLANPLDPLSPHTYPIVYTGGGTSGAAPRVSGTVALMLSVYDCLTPNEADSILKLTTKDVEAITALNAIFQGQIGAGALDTGDAVEFVNEMKKINGNAVIDNHIFNRFNFKLDKINNNLKIENVTFRDNCTAEFTAKNQIQVKGNSNTVFKPNATGLVTLKINPNISITCTPVVLPKVATGSNIEDSNNSSIVLYPNPNNGTFELSIKDIPEFKNSEVNINVFDINGRLVYQNDININSNTSSTIPLSLTNIASGIYFVKVSNNSHAETLKFIKK